MKISTWHTRYYAKHSISRIFLPLQRTRNLFTPRPNISNSHFSILLPLVNPAQQMEKPPTHTLRINWRRGMFNFDKLAWSARTNHWPPQQTLSLSLSRPQNLWARGKSSRALSRVIKISPPSGKQDSPPDFFDTPRVQFVWLTRVHIVRESSGPEYTRKARGSGAYIYIRGAAKQTSLVNPK